MTSIQVNKQSVTSNHSPCAKRANDLSSNTLSDQPVKKQARRNNPKSGTQRCDELRALLLKKAGIYHTDLDATRVQHLLVAEYSPRVVHLLNSISDSLRKAGDLSDDDTLSQESVSLSNVTLSSDDDDFDHVLPSSSESTSRASIERLDTPSSSSKKPSLSPVKSEQPSDKQTTYKNETEIAISRIFDLGKVASVENTTIPADAPYDGPSVITMTGFGELGRYGNQVLQYVFMKCYAACHGIEQIQVPSWVGARLFGLHDRPVQRALPAAVEFRGTVANSTFTTDFIDYVKNSNKGKTVPELFPDVLAPQRGGETNGLKNVDMWGWFQWHTSHFAPYKTLIQETFTAVPELYNALHSVFDEKLRYRDGLKRTVVGLHLRLGDYQNIAASSFGYCAPTSWYLTWLEKIWPTLENPVLMVASDDIDAVLRDFAAYSPVTSDSLGMTVPESMKGLKAGFFPDWFCLTQCDVLAISNSTFSFSACMMNQRPEARFFRAHYRGVMEEFDAWNADPIVHRDMNKAGLKAAVETLQIVYNTQGSRGVARNLLYELPYYGIRSAIMKAVLWRQSNNNSISVC